MQPGDNKEEFQAPGEAQYFSVAPEVNQTPAATENIPSTGPVTPPSPDEDNVITWEAPEHPQQEHGLLWFLALGFAAFVLILLDVFLIKSFLFSFSLLTIVMAVALVLYSSRPADMMHYVLSDKGLYINDTLHGFAEFKGFGVLHDGVDFSVELMPVRRFRPSLSVYFPEDRGEAIVDVLGVRLPMEQLKPDFFDRIIRSLGL